MDKIVLGCDSLLQSIPPTLKKGGIVLFCNQASVTSEFRPFPDELARHGIIPKFILSPQHGFFSEKQANMVESSHEVHPSLGISIYSLYGPMFAPPQEIFKNIDILLIDLQDVGTRVYTYMTTMGLVLESLSGLDVSVWILDRPNPLGNEAVEGNIVESSYQSFVGRYSIPMRHGLTVGEYAKWVLKEKQLDIDITVFPVKNLDVRSHYNDTGLPWIFPSPNMPSYETALVYPGMVLLEGTNISEGRGTALPFQIFGAPFIDPYRLFHKLLDVCCDDVIVRPVYFEPLADKWKGERCGGFHMYVKNPKSFKPFRFGLTVIKFLRDFFPDRFEWSPPPYEYEYGKLPIDIILGTDQIRRAIEQEIPIELLEATWKPQLKRYMNLRESCRIYP